MSDQLSRRDWIKAATALGAGALLPDSSNAQPATRPTEAPGQSYDTFTAAEQVKADEFFPKINFAYYPPLPKPVSAIVCGYGMRGRTYAGFAQTVPDEWKIVGVAEPIEYKRNDAVATHKLAPENVFDSWEKVFERPKFADVVVVSMQDAMHVAPALRAIEAGYDILLEKPIAQRWEECEQIRDAAKKHNRIVAVCHVLRYAPYFMMMREVIRSGKIGKPITVQHMEPVWNIHFSHSYVRGPWRRKAESNPVIIAKSCHDTDLIYFLLDRKVTRVSSYGDLQYFRKENAPAGAPQFCMDGCPVQATCPYFAPDVYVNKKKWNTGHIVTADRSPEGILAALKQGQYGRCVYHCDNDVCDHMVTIMELEGGGTASFHLTGLAGKPDRRTRIACQRGWIEGDQINLTVWDFEKGTSYTWNANAAANVGGGHGGGDLRLVRDFCQAVSLRDVGKLTSNLDESMLSHLICYKAEESRCDGGRPREL